MKATPAQFVSEILSPVTDMISTTGMAGGEPGLPTQFTWRGQPLTITSVRRSWRETGPCKTHGVDRYRRKHWFEVETGQHGIATIYFDRQPRSKNMTARWTLYTIEPNQ